MMPFQGDVFPPMMPALTTCLDTVPHWLQTSFVLVLAFFAVSLLVGFFQPVTEPSQHKDSL